MSVPMIVTNLRCEYLDHPLGIDVMRPRLSWQIQTEQRGVRQSAYQLLIASTRETLARDATDIWDSGRVDSAQAVQVIYAGPDLISEQRYWWKVRVWDGDGNALPYSESSWWEMGILKSDEWQAQWISLPQTQQETAAEPNKNMLPSPYLRKAIKITQPLKQARLYVTARGLYEMHINGQRVGSALFTPGWTDYHKRIQYQTYDVTNQLHSGDNVLGAILGTGWYAGHIGWPGDNNTNFQLYGAEPQLLLQLQIIYGDETRETIVSDASWRGSTGAIQYSDILHGESYDARQELSDWHMPAYHMTGWNPVTVAALDDVLLVADHAEPIQVTEELHPQHIEPGEDGTFIIDLGQNMIGWERLRVQGPAGTRVQMRFGEKLNADGSLHTINLRSAQQTDVYYLKGSEQPEIFEPHFTFHGFRYIEVSGYPGELTPDAFTARVIHSNTPFLGEFNSSHPLINQLQKNINWGQRSNFLSIPTDCPQRDERLGWMGDAQIFIWTACYNAHVAAFFTKWMVDVVDAQADDGGFSDVSPRLVDLNNGAPAWGDAGIIIPWTLYHMYGDTRIIEQHYEAMQRWIAYIQQANPDLLWTQKLNNNYGDWLSIDADTPKEVLATAYFAYDAQLMAQMADIIGLIDDSQKYQHLFEEIKAAFIKAYVSADGKVEGETQTSYLLALYMNLLPDDLRPLAAQHLVADIERHDWHLTTGFVGIGYLCPVLSQTGYNDVAYRLVLNDTFPSWGYSIKHGATTIWERWDGWTEHNGFHEHTMNSFNHYSLGSVGQWLYQYAAGIDLDLKQLEHPRCIIRPYPDSRLEYINASYPSIAGTIKSAWRLHDNRLTVNITIPANMTATVSLPAQQRSQIFEGDVQAETAPGIQWQGAEVIGHAQQTRQLFELTSGAYTFQIEQ